MKFFRNKQSKFYFGLIMSSTMFLVSCKKEIIQEQNIPVTKNEISGKDWFKSIYFADGSVTTQLADLKEYTPKKRGLSFSELKELREYENQVISEMLIINPNFFETFKSDMESQDPVVIENSIETSKVIFKESLRKVYLKKGLNLDDEVKKSLKGGSAQEKGVGWVLLVTIAIVIFIVINISKAGTRTSSWLTSTVDQPAGTISNQTLVSNIATATY